MLPGAYRGRILTINLNDGGTGTIDTARSPSRIASSFRPRKA